MKKKILLIILMALLFCGLFSVNSLAVGGVDVGHPDEVALGETVAFEVSLDDSYWAKSGGIAVEYDHNVFEYVRHRWHTDFIIQNFDGTTGVGVWASDVPVEVGDLIFTLYLKVKDNADYGTTSMAFSPILSDGNNDYIEFNSEVIDTRVVCREHHSVSPADCLNDEVCYLCGSVMTPALGHIDGEWIVERVAAPGVSGLEVQRCARAGCDAILKRYETPPTDAPRAIVDAYKDSVIYDQNVDFYITVSQCELLKSMAIVPIFDSNIFEYVSGGWLIPGELSYVDPMTYRSVIAWSEPTNANTAVYKLTLKAIELTSATEVSATAMYQAADGTEDLFVFHDTVSVIECPHENVTYVAFDDNYHSVICDICGYTEYEYHTFDNGCDTNCNVCGFVRPVTHIPDTVYDVNTNEHWLFCTVCGMEIERGSHEYDGDSDAHCNACGFCRVIRGDLNGDGRVTSDDAILLLNYSYFQHLYSINQDGDINGDGVVTSDDAILLLNYSYFPHLYSLSYPADHFECEYRIH